MLLAPFIKIKTTLKEEPIIAILLDNSLSMQQDKNFNLDNFKKSIESLSEKLKGKYKIAIYGFGASIQKDSVYKFNQKATNISNAISEIDNEFYNQNLVSLIVASDGLYNEGINPVYIKTETPFSIQTIKLGDTAVKRDIRIANVSYNQFVYLGDKTPLEIDIEAEDCAGANISMDIFQVSQGQVQKLNSNPVAVLQKQFAKTLQSIIECKNIGINHYRIVINQLTNELTYKNNVRDIFIEVIDGRKKILINAVAPHPDITAIKHSLESSKNYQVDIDLTDKKINSLQDYQLVIFHQVPSFSKSMEALVKATIVKQIPTLFILGTQSNFNLLNQWQEAITVEKRGENKQDVLPIFNDNFQLFTLSDELKNEIQKFPNLEIPFSNIKLKTNGNVLFYQKIGAIKTEYPMISFFDNNLSGKKGFICGEGIWKWKLNNFRTKNNHLIFDELILKITNYLAVKKDNRPFRVIQQKQLYKENEIVEFDAQLYNETFELINTPVANITITDQKGKDYKYVFTPKDKYYHISCGYFAEGEYGYKASVIYNSKTHTFQGKFIVAPQQLEFMSLTADHGLMNTLANKRAGKSYFPNQLDEMAAELLQDKNVKTYLYDVTNTNLILNLWPILALIILLLGMEWVLRKWGGSY